MTCRLFLVGLYASISLFACAPMTETRTSTPVSSRMLVLGQRPLPDSDQVRVVAQRDGDALVLSVQRQRLCRTLSVEERRELHTLVREPSVPVIVTEIGLAALGALGAYAFARTAESDLTGADAAAVACGAFAVGEGIAATVDIASADTKQSTATLRGAPRETLVPCPAGSFEGIPLRVEGPGIRAASVLDRDGRAVLKLPAAFWQEPQDITLDIYLANELVGIVSLPGGIHAR